MYKLSHTFFILLLLCSTTSSQSTWTECTFTDFIDGTFYDAGANMYVSHNGRIQTINRWDVNGDGNIDILCVNSHPLVEMLDMSIYWGDGKDFSIKNHSYIPADGPMWVAADDLNNDGEMDLVVANYSNGTWTEMESFVYYGGLKDRHYQKAPGEWAFYPFKERITLPSANAQKPAIGDFNNDGYKDIVFAFSGGFWEYRNKNKRDLSPSRIYWGSKAGFDQIQFTNILTKGATDVAAADLNNDNWLDLVFSNGEGDESFIYYGSENGFFESSLTRLPTHKPHAVEVGDVDNDGWLDVVFANEAGDISCAYLNEAG
ncbi:VCBS repeat-containing protein, partial [candidate division KSB1 bacterium]|nr:VCBS repeat-containing protein [candidate division KSB1 bacterium]